jgi:hypothetical protein
VGLLVTPLLERKGALSGIFDLVSSLLFLALLHELERLYNKGRLAWKCAGSSPKAQWLSWTGVQLSVKGCRSSRNYRSGDPNRLQTRVVDTNQRLRCNPVHRQADYQELGSSCFNGQVLTYFLSMTNKVRLRPFAILTSAWCPFTMSHQYCSCCSLLLNHKSVLRLHNIHP